ncbi:MAG TPA: sugar ABC transporter ATP-binding protein [Xanthobacteraceae bacterium]|jgi:ribose transport system ATP-binding protein
MPLPVLHVTNIAKNFGGAKALAGISFEVFPGEVHGLLGKNGSGKSTLVKILAGFHAPDPGGKLEFNGQAVDLPLKAGDFRRLGMSFVHQNLGLAPSLTVLENLRFADLTTKPAPFINWRNERKAAAEALGRFGLTIDPDERVSQLSPVERALLAIVRAFEEIRAECAATGKPGLVLLDEPTPFLPREGVDKLFALMRSIAATSSSIIFISHDIEEVMAITDRITVLRDGIVAGELKTADATHEQVVELIVGRSLAKRAAAVHAEIERLEPFVRIENLAGGSLRETSFAVGRGEILGLTGLIGSGYEQAPYLIFGARPCRSGTIHLMTNLAPIPIAYMSPDRALALDFALLPGDRQNAGGVDGLPIVDNMLLPDVTRFFRGGFLRRGAMMREAHALGTRYEVRPNDPAAKLSTLSGGNAQKVLIARWMNRKPRLLLLDEPTQGVDVGTRVQIYAALKAASASGTAIVCASSDAEQLAEICDRVLVFAKGKICRELTGAELTKDGVAEACYVSLDVAGGAQVRAVAG